MPNCEDVETAERVGVARTEDEDVQRVGARRLAQNAQCSPKALAWKNHPVLPPLLSHLSHTKSIPQKTKTTKTKETTRNTDVHFSCEKLQNTHKQTHKDAVSSLFEPRKDNQSDDGDDDDMEKTKEG